MACVAVLSLMRTLELEFLQSQPRPILQQNELISCNKQLVQSLHEKLGPLMELFDENRMDGVEAIKKLETKLRDVAFRTEDEIELQVVHLYEEEEEEEEKEFHLFHLEMPHCQRLHQILHPLKRKSHPCLKFHRILHRAKQDIDAIQEELVKVKMEFNHLIALQGRKTTLDATPKFDQLVTMDSSCKHASNSKEIMVGKQDEFEIIKEMLIGHPSIQREVVSIQGMGGIGKKTLARRVYEDPSISSHFDKRAWVVASQHHDKRQMLEGLLNSIGNAGSGSDEDLAEQLYRYLMHQRYFIVIDDMWSDEAWDDVKSCFPDNRNCSRVLVITRSTKVPTHIGSNNDFSHQVNLLDQSESWNLFHEKACRSRRAEFEAIGIPIVEKCKGLPLAILVVAGLFSKLDTLEEWKNTAEALNSSATTTVDEECSKILSSSYNHLPCNLKACFLYLSIFPEDEEIRVKKLVKLWAAEGLANEFENMSFDAVAKRHIQELKDRNLILVSRRSCCGRKIKAFRMHDVLHSFCVREAQKENLLHVVYKNGFNSPLKGFRWVSIQSKKFYKKTFFPFSKNCRSILSFLPTNTCDLNLKICNLVRVLCDVECKIENLVHLRFLYSSHLVFETSIPDFKKPFHAWNLQTLFNIGRVDEMNFLEFPQLQHFYCDTIPTDCPIFFHQNLKSIYWLRHCHYTKELFRNIPYLKKVRIECAGEDWNDCITNLTYLHQLQNLQIFGRFFPLSSGLHIVLLKNLKKLTFHVRHVESKVINILSKLSMLEVLKLEVCTTIDGKEWKLSEEETFGQLIYLEISILYLKNWEARAFHFPKLEHLFLHRCYELKEIPADFTKIPKLKSIKLMACLPSVVASAKRIQEEQRDYGNGDIVVIEEYTREPYEYEE